MNDDLLLSNGFARPAWSGSTTMAMTIITAMFLKGAGQQQQKSLNQ